VGPPVTAVRAALQAVKAIAQVEAFGWRTDFQGLVSRQHPGSHDQQPTHHERKPEQRL
jgi:hypothetical protein